MKAFTMLVNGKEDFSAAMAKVRPEWMRLRSSKPNMSKDMELMTQACENVSTPDFKVTIKKLA